MNPYVIAALAATLATWFVTAMGAAVVFFFRGTGVRSMNAMLGFAAGVMIAASFWSLLQPAIQRAEAAGGVPAWLVATLGFLTGALFLVLSDWMLSRALCGTQSKNHRIRRAALLVLSITLHNIPEGLAVGVAFGALVGSQTPHKDMMGAIAVAVGIGLQNFPEGAAVSLPLRREGASRKRSFLIGQASGVVEPIAGLSGALLVSRMEAILPYALSFAAGAMILVAVHELIPESQADRRSGSYTATIGIILGFAAMMLLDVMLG